MKIRIAIGMDPGKNWSPAKRALFLATAERLAHVLADFPGMEITVVPVDGDDLALGLQGANEAMNRVFKQTICPLYREGLAILADYVESQK